MVTVVWGRPYIDLFLDVTVPNQLTPGNLGALPAGSRYRVFTSPEDADRLSTSPVLSRVSELMPVDLIVMPELSDSSTEPLARLTAGQCRALDDASDVPAALIFPNADVFMSEGALAAVVRRHAEGWRAVTSLGVRLDKQKFVAALQERVGGPTLLPRDLVSLALANLHPFARAHMVNGAKTACWPINLYWGVPGEGILARAFYLHPLMVDPVFRDVRPKKGFTLDAKYLVGACPRHEDVHVVTDSDELGLYELSDVDAAVVELAPGGIPLWRVAGILGRCDAHQRAFWPVSIRLHAGDRGGAWETVERDSARFCARAWKLRVVASSLRLTIRRLNRYRRRAGELGKRLRRVVKPLSPPRVGRSMALLARRASKFGKRSVRICSGIARRTHRSMDLLAHSIGRPMRKLRKRATRAGRRAMAR